MHKAEFRALAGAIALGGMLAAGVPATAADKTARTRVIGVEGVAKGNADRRVEVLVRVPAGKSARSEGDRALAAQGAVRAAAPQAARYTFTGLRWDVLHARGRRPGRDRGALLSDDGGRPALAAGLPQSQGGLA